MITAIHLNSGDSASTARFWGALFNVEPVYLGGGRWRIEPIAGPAVVVSPTTVAEAISEYADMTVVPFPGAADRLRALGFEVADDGSQAVDLNGCDNTVRLVARGWDGVSDVDWEDWTPAQIEAALRRRPGVRDYLRTIPSVDPSAVARFLEVWFEAKRQRPEFGVRWVQVGGTTFQVEPAIAPARQWVPLGARDYAAAVARVQSAGFDVVPSASHPEVAGHCDVGNVTFVLTEVDR